MFENKNEKQVNEGVNIVVHRHVAGGKDGTDVILMGVYSKEEGHGKSTKYADALKAAFGKAALEKSAERKKARDEYALESGRTMARLAKPAFLEGIRPTARANRIAKMQSYAKEAEEKIGDLNNRLANPLHDLTEKEFADIMSAGKKALLDAGLKLVEEKCQEHAYPNLVMTYLVYA